MKSRLVNWGVADRQLTNGERWATLIFLLLYATFSMYNQVKPTTIMVPLGMQFGMDLSTIGNLMTFYSIAGLVISMPGVWLMRNIGIKTSLAIGGVIQFIGTMVGIYSTTVGMLMFSRVLEGVGLSVITVLGPNVMPRLFPSKKLGLVMGVWSMWPAIGIIVNSLASPQLYAMGDWQAIWWFSAIINVIALVLCIIFVKFNKVSEKDLENKAIEESQGKKNNYVASGVIISVLFVVYCGLYGNVNTFYPTFLQEVKGMSLAASALPPLLYAVLTIPLSIVIGMVTDKFSIRKWWLVGTYALIAICGSTFFFTVSSETVTPWLTAIVVAIFAGGAPVTTRALIPLLISDERKMDYVLGIMSLTTYAGFMFSTPYGALAAMSGWPFAAMVFFGGMGIASAIIIAVFVKSDTKLAKGQA